MCEHQYRYQALKPFYTYERASGYLLCNMCDNNIHIRVPSHIPDAQVDKYNREIVKKYCV